METNIDEIPDEQRLLDILDKHGGRAGNVTLQRELKNEQGWAEDKYWAVRNGLVDSGRIGLGKGRGGSVHRIEVIPPTPASEREAEETRRVESDLYEPIANVLRDAWVKDFRFVHSHVEITAKQGRRETGGKWSRPDLTVVGVSTYQFLPSKYLDLVTFEVKTADALDVAAVYEALAHRRAATRSYVLLHVPAEREAELEADLDDLCDEAERHGIGVIVVANPREYSTWNVRVSASRTEPDPKKLNDFIAQQLPDRAKTDLSRALR
jgi:hypothetical protein